MEKVTFQVYPHYIKRMEQFYLENATTNTCDIVLLGDSIVEMFDPNYLNLPQYKIINRGIVSDKSHGVLISLEDRVKPINPKLVFLLIGSNDICDGYLLKEITSNIQNIAKIIHSYNENTKIVISTVLPPCYYSAPHVDNIYPNCRDINKLIALNEKIIKICQENSLYLFDGYNVLADEKGSLNIDDTIDGIHLSRHAYSKITNSLRPLLLDLLEGDNQ